MKLFHGTALVTVFMTALVAAAIFVLVERGGGQRDSLLAELTENSLPGTTGPYSVQEKNDSAVLARNSIPGTNGPYSALDKTDTPNTVREKLSENQPTNRGDCHEKCEPRPESYSTAECVTVFN